MAKYCEISPNIIFIAGGFKNKIDVKSLLIIHICLIIRELCNQFSLDRPRTRHYLKALARKPIRNFKIIFHILHTKEFQRYNTILDD